MIFYLLNEYNVYLDYNTYTFFVNILYFNYKEYQYNLYLFLNSYFNKIEFCD